MKERTIFHFFKEKILSQMEIVKQSTENTSKLVKDQRKGLEENLKDYCNLVIDTSESGWKSQVTLFE